MTDDGDEVPSPDGGYTPDPSRFYVDGVFDPSKAVSEALRALDAAGWVCVPKVATDEIVEAISDVAHCPGDVAERSWELALYAAPKLVKP
jgi:hypothetical protein